MPIFDSLKFKIITVVVAVLLLVAVANEVSRWVLPAYLGTPVNFGSIFVSFIIIFWYVRKKLDPLEQLVQVARKLGAGDLTVRMDTAGRDEVKSLSTAFNEMADKLVAQIESLKSANQVQSEFISVTAHNLQTPLVVMLGYLEKLEDSRENLTSEQVAALKDLKAEVLGLRELNSRLLSTVELQGELVSLNLKKQDLALSASRAFKQLKKRAEKKEVNLRFEAAREPLEAEFDEEWIGVVWENLLDNAIKYTPSEGQVTIRVGKTKDVVFGEVEDTGMGIPESEKEKILLPFHRAKGVRQANVQGVGLGLYIVKLVIEKHHGKLEVESTEGKGTKIRFTLPLAKEK
jgi:signal transduction histidine kinase